MDFPVRWTKSVTREVPWNFDQKHSVNFPSETRVRGLLEDKDVPYVNLKIDVTIVEVLWCESTK